MVFDGGLLHEPGETFAYSNANYLALGAVIEEATGRGYEDYCRAAVITPVGAKGALSATARRADVLSASA